MVSCHPAINLFGLWSELLRAVKMVLFERPKKVCLLWNFWVATFCCHLLDGKLPPCHQPFWPLAWAPRWWAHKLLWKESSISFLLFFLFFSFSSFGHTLKYQIIVLKELIVLGLYVLQFLYCFTKHLSFQVKRFSTAYSKHVVGKTLILALYECSPNIFGTWRNFIGLFFK